MLAQKRIIYVDETTVNLWTRKNKTWQLPKHPIKVILNEQRGQSMTVYGGIVTDSQRFVHQTFSGGTTSDNTVQFLTHLVEQLGTDVMQNAILVWDRHPAHRSNRVQRYLLSVGVQLLELPTASSALNNIERCWNVLKHHFNQNIFGAAGLLTQE